MLTTVICGSLPSIIRNSDELYVGNLIPYFKAVFFRAQNLRNPYHNFRHMTHVLFLCYEACEYYREAMTRRAMRELLIGALFHDFDHSGMMGNDDLNIERAVRGFRAQIQDDDRESEGNIIDLIRSTEFPYVVSADSLTLSGKILRDADVSQAFSVAWIQQVIFGLATEWGKQPIEVLRLQEPFLNQLSFHTLWAKAKFPKDHVQSKIAEARAMLELLSN